MAALVRDHDWSTTALGAEPSWPSSLVTLVRVMLAARQPMFIAWGEERTLLYNDAYTPMLGALHPVALGQPFFEVWPEVRREVGILMNQIFAGQPVQMDDLCLTLHRNGYEEEPHFAFSYTPIPSEAGSGTAVPKGGRAIQSLFCACTETTLQVRAENEIARAAAYARCSRTWRGKASSNCSTGCARTTNRSSCARPRSACRARPRTASSPCAISRSTTAPAWSPASSCPAMT